MFWQKKNRPGEAAGGGATEGGYKGLDRDRRDWCLTEVGNDPAGFVRERRLEVETLDAGDEVVPGSGLAEGLAFVISGLEPFVVRQRIWLDPDDCRFVVLAMCQSGDGQSGATIEVAGVDHKRDVASDQDGAELLSDPLCQELTHPVGLTTNGRVVTEHSEQLIELRMNCVSLDAGQALKLWVDGPKGGFAGLAEADEHNHTPGVRSRFCLPDSRSDNPL